VTARGIPSARGILYAREVPCGTCGKHSIFVSMNQEGMCLQALNCTLGDCCVKVIVIVVHFFIDKLISYL
jgi:hypothetical protein